MEFSLYFNYFCIIFIFTLFFSILIDLIIGDPKSKYHPVMLIGKTINWFKSKLRTGKLKLDKILGIFLLFIVVIIFCVPIYLFQIFFWWSWNIIDSTYWNIPNITSIIVFSIVMGFILKWSFAIKSMGDATLPIGKALSQGDLEKARKNLSLIVRRDTESLEEPYIISASVECIAESTTDAVTSVIWFYLIGNLLGVIIFIYFQNQILWLFLGIPFAYIYRIINTADSVVGYKDEENINIGWFSARMDDVSNYLPTRLTVLFMLLAGKLLKSDVKNAWKVLKSDRKTTESVNAGWTMGVMAGLLNIQLEKIGKYKLGKLNRAVKSNDIKAAYRIYQLTAFLFTLVLSSAIILIIYVLYLH